MRSELTDAVRDATRDEFELAAELGGGEEWAVFLGRRLDGGALAILLLQEAEDGDGQFDLEVIEAVEAGLPVGRTTCASCGAGESGWPRFCGVCGADLSGVRADAAVPGASAAELLREVCDAAEDEYRVLGAMPHAEGGGALYFAREVATGRMVGLTLREAEGELALAVSWTPEADAPARPDSKVFPPQNLPPPDPPRDFVVPEEVVPPPPLLDPPGGRARVRSRESARRVAGVAAVAAVGAALVIAVVLAIRGPGAPPSTPDDATNGMTAAPSDTAAHAAPAPLETAAAHATAPVETEPVVPAPSADERPSVASAESGAPAVQTAAATPALAGPAVPAPPPAPAVPTAEGAEEAVLRYAQAVATCETAQVRGAYPGITAREVQQWTGFFRDNCGGGMRWTYERERAVAVTADQAEVIFTLTLSYTDAAGSPAQLPLPMRALLEWTEGRWSLQQVRSLAGR